ncbi:Iron(III)-hydroxamate-binding protein fhuD [Cedecea lapagei]|uniref:Iron(III)-hydroxamate-binding protein fhuD n=1 Tax=Cedecea lapagei TaxID=158823 RepID=A0A3S4J4P4_9ENTR|nr:iron-siderophore ABC transporter substrate-binding protein [Cedecea lapagei]VEC00378.1 Iron(III)-hydroxamate-binding protein fhuD [Cedecea lapagei]
MLSRRRFLTFALAAPFIGVAGASSGPPRRLAVLDWGLTELILALGVTPQSVSAPDWYRKLIGTPELPASVVDIGLLFQPNLETLSALQPDLIVITPGHALLKPQLERIAPTLTLPTGSLAEWRISLDKLAAVLHRETQALAVLAAFEQAAQRAGETAAAFHRPLLLATPVDALHMRLYGKGSLAGDVLARCGFSNAWRGGVNTQGEAMVELTRIGAEDAGLILLPEEGLLPMIQRWRDSLLWQRLPLTSQHQLAFPAEKFNSGGALVTATRIADALGQIVTGWLHG